MMYSICPAQRKLPDQGSLQLQHFSLCDILFDDLTSLQTGFLAVVF